MGREKVKVMKVQKNPSGLKKLTQSYVSFWSVSLADGSASSTFLQTNSSTSTSSFSVFTSSSPLCWDSLRLLNMHPKRFKIIICQDGGRSLFSSVCCQSWAQWLGKHSLALYLSHEPVRRVINTTCFPTLMEFNIKYDVHLDKLITGSGRPFACIGCKVGQRATMLALKERHLTYGE